jgi:hypothetical protein
MSGQPLAGGDSLSASRMERIDQVCDRFEDGWKKPLLHRERALL